MAQVVRLGSRGSALAVAQVERIRERLEALGETVAIEIIRTSGDERPGGRPAPETEDKERFVKEIEDALVAGRIDLAVHSAKDVPTQLPAGLALIGVPERLDPRDAVCGAESLAAIPEGALVGTASLRRRSQLLARRPDLDVREVRGNVDTRLRKLAEGEFAAIVLAAAGLERLGIESGTPVPCGQMTPAPGQGCLALEARADDAGMAELGRRLSNPEGEMALAAERALIAGLDATCHTPVGAFARERGGVLRVTGYAGLPDGSAWLSDTIEGDPADPAPVGATVAERMLAAGAREILDAAERADPARSG